MFVLLFFLAGVLGAVVPFLMFGRLDLDERKRVALQAEIDRQHEEYWGQIEFTPYSRRYHISADEIARLVK